jgi:hypothetical protein
MSAFGQSGHRAIDLNIAIDALERLEKEATLARIFRGPPPPPMAAEPR